MMNVSGEKARNAAYPSTLFHAVCLTGQYNICISVYNSIYLYALVCNMVYKHDLFSLLCCHVIANPVSEQSVTLLDNICPTLRIVFVSACGIKYLIKSVLTNRQGCCQQAFSSPSNTRCDVRHRKWICPNVKLLSCTVHVNQKHE